MSRSRSRPPAGRAAPTYGPPPAASDDTAALAALAERRAERLRRLREAGHALSGTLDEVEVARELARQIERLVECEGAGIILCDGAERRAAAWRNDGEEIEPRASVRCDHVVAEVVRVRTPIRLAADDPSFPSPYGRTLVGIPVMAGDEMVAVIAAWSKSPSAFDDEEFEGMLILAAHAASAIGSARRYAESLRERSRGEALADIARAVNASVEVGDVAELILRHAVALLHAHGAGLAIVRDESAMRIVAAIGAGEQLLGMDLPTEGTVAGRALRNRAPEICNDPFADPDAYAPTREAGAIERILIVPLLASEGAIGVIAVINRASDFTEEDASVLQRLAEHVAVSVVNARLFAERNALAERYRRVLETTSDAIVIVDRDRRIGFTNPAADALLGVAAAPMGLPISTFLAPELQDRVAGFDARALAGEPQRYEARIVTASGDRRLVAVSTAPLRDGDTVIGIVASMRDVTDERRARDAVAHSEARYRNLFESATDAIYTLDAEGCFTSVNAATCALIGVPREELLGRNALPFIAAGDVDSVFQHFKSALAGTARHYECQFTRADGTRRLASVTNTPIRNRTGVVGVLGVARDVTDERERAAALARSEARYSRLVESASDAIFTVDDHGVLTSVNRSLERAVGRVRDALLGVPFADLLDQRDRAVATHVLAATMLGERKRVELRYPAPGGELRACSLLTTPIVEDGRVTGVLGIVRDVTEEQRLTEQLMQQEKLAAVGQLVSGVAHELNNPLAGVMAFSQLLLAAPTESEPPDQRRAIEAIHQEAKRAAKIVSNLLTFARQHQPERQLTDLNRVVTDTVELRRYALRVQGVEVELRLDPLLPLTWADPFQLQQVALNLLTNAEQALAEWPGERRILIETSRAGATLVVRVQDTGPGIEGVNLGRVFNPFFTTKPVGEGTGLGLSISDGIVREHGGRIRVESRAAAADAGPSGATFVIELPHTPPPAAERETREPPAPRQPGAHRYLVVDDEPAIRTAIGTYLRSMGHDVHTAADGREALDCVAANRYDGVVLDLRMPEVPGDDVYRELVERDPELARRVVFLTGDIQSDSARQFLADTGRPVVTKPFLLDDLAAALLLTSST